MTNGYEPTISQDWPGAVSAQGDPILLGLVLPTPIANKAFNMFGQATLLDYASIFSYMDSSWIDFFFLNHFKHWWSNIEFDLLNKN